MIAGERNAMLLKRTSPARRPYLFFESARAVENDAAGRRSSPRRVWSKGIEGGWAPARLAARQLRSFSARRLTVSAPRNLAVSVLSKVVLQHLPEMFPNQTGGKRAVASERAHFPSTDGAVPSNALSVIRTLFLADASKRSARRPVRR